MWRRVLSYFTKKHTGLGLHALFVTNHCADHQNRWRNHQSRWHYRPTVQVSSENCHVASDILCLNSLATVLLSKTIWRIAFVRCCHFSLKKLREHLRTLYSLRQISQWFVSFNEFLVNNPPALTLFLINSIKQNDIKWNVGGINRKFA